MRSAIDAYEGPHPGRRAVCGPRTVLPRKVQVVSPTVTGVARVADEPEGRTRCVLRRLGPVREAIDVIPRPAAPRHQVHCETERMLPVRGVSGWGVAIGDGEVV